MKSINTIKPAENAEESQSVWVKTPVANLMKYEPSGIYYARVRRNNKLYRASLKTKVMAVAQRKLANYVNDIEKSIPDGEALGKMTMGGAADLLLARLKCRRDIKESSKQSRRFYVQALLNSCPDLKDMLARKPTKDTCLLWAKRFSDYSPSAYNGIVTTLRMLFEIAMEKGARVNNPAVYVKSVGVPVKELHLPSPQQFEQFIEHMKNAGGRFSYDCADLALFLAYSGLRISEARTLTWQDVSFESGTIRVRITKNGKARSVPMIGELRSLLQRLKSDCPQATSNDPVLLVTACEESMTRAAKKVEGMSRITHHDLRHLFATRCIESGVDIPTVSRWLGHQDGGALAMRVYGHLRDSHSASMAAKVSFAVAPAPAAAPALPS